MKNRALLALLAFASAFVVQARGLDPESLRPSVVRIIAPDRTGSGFVVASNSDGCRIATNYHVIEAAGNGGEVLVARLNGDKIECYEGVVVWSDSQHDLAVLLVKGMVAEPLTISTLEPAAAEDAYALGFPAVADDEASGMQFFLQLMGTSGNVVSDPSGQATRYVTASVSKGGVRRVVLGKWDPSHTISEFKIVESDVNFTAGNSGGPLLNKCGEVIGINTERIPDEHMPIDIVRKSSHSSALIPLLRREGISFSSTSEPCVAAAPMVTAPVQQKGLLGLVAVLSAAALGTALFVAIRKPQVVRESYTQFIRRAGETTQTFRQHLLGSRGSSTTKKERERHDSAPPVRDGGTTLSLRGHDPEDRSHRGIFWQLPPQASGKQIIGRKSGLVHLRIANSSISGQHAALWRDGRAIFIEDRDSSNGTLINGQRLRPFVAQALRNGDKIQLGDVVLHAEIG